MTTRIGLIFNRYRSDGGTERLTLSVFDALASDDVEWLVLTRRWGGPLPANVRVLECRPFALGRTWRLLSFVRALKERLQQLPVDLIQSQVHLPQADIYRADGGVHAEWLAQRRRAATWFRRWWRRISPYHRVKLRMERQMYASARLQAVICNSPMVRDDIARNFPECRSRLHIIENGIDVEQFTLDTQAHGCGEAMRHRLCISATAPVFVFVGSGFERKGLSTALAALADAPADAHLIVVGRDKRMGWYRRHARRLGVADRVHFMGAQDDVRPFLWAADSLVHPALYEAFGIVIAEAMAAGLPVLASQRTGAALSMLAGPETGRTLDALDVAGFGRAMTELATRSNAERQYAARECETIARSHSTARMRDELLEFYNRFR